MESPYRVYSALSILNKSRAWIEINTAAIRKNYRAICAFLDKNGSKAHVAGVIKAEGYGHGAAAMAEALLAEGCRFFCCVGIDEAAVVRGVCDKMGVDADILLLSYTPVSSMAELLRYRITQSVFSLDYARELSREAQGFNAKLPVHIKINTGMNRLGFTVNDSETMERAVLEICEAVSLEGLLVKGAFTHFARADERGGEGEARTRLQAARFYDAVERLSARGVSFERLHLCASAATMFYPEFHSDMCRAGISLYGLGDFSGVDISLESAIKLKCRVAQVNTLIAGEELGYGEHGEICITGDTMMKGYYNNKEETEYVMRRHADGKIWIHSGDIGYIDEDGFVYVKGRVKRMITRFDGHKVFPITIESFISEDERVHSCSVIAVDDRERLQGQYPMAVIELVEKIDVSERESICKDIYNKCHELLEERGRPVAVVCVNEIPLTAMGKNDYRTLEKEYKCFDYLAWEKNL